MNFKKIFIFILFGLYLLDKHLEGINVEYNRWILIFLFVIAINTANKEKE